MKKENYWVKAGRVAAASALLVSSSSCVKAVENPPLTNPNSSLTFTPEPQHTITPKSSDTSTPTDTLTPQPTATETSTATPDWESLNYALIETALEGESITLHSVSVDKLIVLHLPGIKDLIFGAITNQEGETAVLFENMDCEYQHLRDKGELGEKVDVGFQIIPVDVWNTSNYTFEVMKLIKTGEISGDVEILESESFTADGETTLCPEIPITQPLSDSARQLIEKTKDIVVTLINSLSEQNK